MNGGVIYNEGAGTPKVVNDALLVQKPSKTIPAQPSRLPLGLYVGHNNQWVAVPAGLGITVNGTIKIENSDKSYQVTLGASDIPFIIPDITVTEVDGSETAYPAVQDIACDPDLCPKELVVYLEYAAALDMYNITSAPASIVGTYDLENISLVNCTLDSVKVNSVPVFAVFEIGLGDLIQIGITPIDTGEMASVTLSGVYV